MSITFLGGGDVGEASDGLEGGNGMNVGDEVGNGGGDGVSMGSLGDSLALELVLMELSVEELRL